jgi:hypothetical protein
LFSLDKIPVNQTNIDRQHDLPLMGHRKQGVWTMRTWGNENRQIWANQTIDHSNIETLSSCRSCLDGCFWMKCVLVHAVHFLWLCLSCSSLAHCSYISSNLGW